MILEVVPYQPEKHFWKRWRQKTPQPVIQKIPVRFGGYFFNAQIFLDKNGSLDMETLVSAVGGARYRVILKEGSVLPNHTDFRLFTPKIYPATIFLQQALAFLKEREGDKTKRILWVEDDNACFTEKIIDFVPYVKSLYVYTRRTQKYTAAAEKIKETYGLHIELSQNKEDEKRCNVSIKPFFENADSTVGRLHFTSEKKEIWIMRDIDLPLEFLKKCPPNTNKLLFASALYEICNIKCLETLKDGRLERIKPL